MNDPGPPPEIEIQTDLQNGRPPRSLRWIIAVVVVAFAWWLSLIAGLYAGTPGHWMDVVRWITVGMVPAVLATWKLRTALRFRILMLAATALFPIYVLFFHARSLP